MSLRDISVFAMTLMLGFSAAMAQIKDPSVDAVYEIKQLDDDERVPNQPTIDHFTYYTRTVKCDGADVAVLYKSIGGYSRGTRFIKTCRQSEAGSLKSCIDDESQIAKVCHNKAIDFYGLQNRHAKIDIKSNPNTQQDLDGAPTRAPLPAPAAPRNTPR